MSASAQERLAAWRRALPEERDRVRAELAMALAIGPRAERLALADALDTELHGTCGEDAALEALAEELRCLRARQPRVLELRRQLSELEEEVSALHAEVDELEAELGPGRQP